MNIYTYTEINLALKIIYFMVVAFAVIKVEIGWKWMHKTVLF